MYFKYIIFQISIIALVIFGGFRVHAQNASLSHKCNGILGAPFKIGSLRTLFLVYGSQTNWNKYNTQTSDDLSKKYPL